MKQTQSILGLDAPDASALSNVQLLDLYRTMRTIRAFEERLHRDLAGGELPVQPVFECPDRTHRPVDVEQLDTAQRRRVGRIQTESGESGQGLRHQNSFDFQGSANG